MRRFFRDVIVVLALTPLIASAADMRLLPSGGTISTNEQFDVVVALSSDEPVTAAEASFSFNPAAIRIEGIDTSGSLLVTWPTAPTFSNERGTASFSGSMDAPFTGSEGKLATIRFRAIANGTHPLRIDDAVALGPGGSNVIATLAPGIYTVVPAQLEPEPSAQSIDIIETAPVSVPVPLIERGGDLLPGERLIVRGLVVPGVLVHVHVREGDGEPRLYTVPSAGDGSFTYVSDFRVSEGVYRIWAVTEGKGVRSEPSETVTVTVRPAGLVAAAATAVEVLSLVVPLIAVTALLGGIVALILHRRRR